MSRILAVWELGANMGHIDRMLVTARALRERGHEVHFALRDLSRAHGRVTAEGFGLSQAPVWLPRFGRPPALGNFSLVLAAAGWLDPPGLAALVTGWRTLFDLVRPDALVCDHAPTAMLAARGADFPVWAIGNSFEVPPPGPSFPPLHAAADAPRCAGWDAQVLAPANEALTLLGQPPLARLTDLFAGVRCAIASVPELAHHAGYPDTTVWAGPSYVGDVGVEPAWPAGRDRAPRVFAYLSPTHPGFRPFVAATTALGLTALVHAKGLSAAAAARLGGPTVRFEAAPVRMDAAVSGADIVVSHASLGTVTAALIAGKPQLLLPTHAEQALVAARAVAEGIALALPPLADAPTGAGPPSAAPPDVRAPLQTLLGTPAHAAAAAALARRHAGATPAGTGRRLAALIEASL